MDAFLDDGGFQQDQIKQRKLEQKENAAELETSSEEEHDTEADDQMSGYLQMTKSRLDQRGF